MKSCILSVTCLILIGLFFMSIFDDRANAFYKNIPDWVFIIAALIILAAFALATYWGITGMFGEQKIINLVGSLCSIAGISIYILLFAMDTGKGKETAGQFDHDINKIEKKQLEALSVLLKETNTSPSEIQKVAYWQMHKNTGNFVICIQKGNIIALQVKNKSIENIKPISGLQHLNWLILENCGLKSIEGLNLPSLQRLSVQYNRLSSLAGIENSPQISWLNFKNNPVTDSLSLHQLTNKDLFIEHD